ncbi:unnamed protein product, partial [Prorocentrum cordatum]
ACAATGTASCIKAARQVFFDITELDVESVSPCREDDGTWVSEDDAASGAPAASAALVAPPDEEAKREIQLLPPRAGDAKDTGRLVSLSDSDDSSDGDAEDTGRLVPLSDEDDSSDDDCDSSESEDVASAAEPSAASGAMRVGAWRTAWWRCVVVHSNAYYSSWPREAIMWLCEQGPAKERRRRISRLIKEMSSACDHILHPGDAMEGIHHWNDTPEYWNQRWVRAWASHQMHYLRELTDAWEDISLGDGKYWFCNAWPNLVPAASGAPRVERLPRDHPGWGHLREMFGINSIPEFLNHLFNKHDGEWRDVEWILNGQSDGHTTLLRRAPTASGAASGMFEVDMRQGQVVTLAHMFSLGAGYCTAYDMYKLHMDLPILAHKHKR